MKVYARLDVVIELDDDNYEGEPEEIEEMVLEDAGNIFENVLCDEGLNTEVTIVKMGLEPVSDVD